MVWNENAHHMATRGSYNSPIHRSHAARFRKPSFVVRDAHNSSPPVSFTWTEELMVRYSLMFLHVQQFQSRKELEVMHVLVENLCIIKN